MTRFARAKGSKASNEKLPEAATSWSEMKQGLLNKNKQLEEDKEREEALKRRQANYKAFLDEKEEEESKKTSWADFPESNSVNGKRKSNGNFHSNKKTRTDSSSGDEEFEALKSQLDKIFDEKGVFQADNSDDEPPEEVTVKEKPQEVVIKKVKKVKPKLKIVSQKEKQSSDPSNDLEDQQNKNEVLSKDEKMKLKKYKRYRKEVEKKKLKKAEEKLKVKQQSKQESNVNNNSENKSEVGEKILNEEELKKIQKKKEKLARQADKKKAFNKTKLVNNDNQINSQKPPYQNLTTGFSRNTQPLNNDKRKPAKTRDNKEHQSRKQKPETMFINGKTVEIDYVDGFPVKKEDAERLKQLRKDMISKGLPRSEINIALKLERRKAEKAFAREKKKVCFKCRKSGHNLSECPELNKHQVVETAGSGICFKCGSTEHSHFECKVVKGMDYKFANCFICKEQGHIAKQCPDNQRGLYPKGGACKVCGDVTHLKKDCPKYQAQQAQLQESLSIGTLDTGNPEDLNDYGNRNHNVPKVQKRINKIIKF
ncbi:hypothetical protein ABEB36_009042 [Hypothenemus hampei]|uniref:CCHC-type domain-containing protein n=1 Tax=Hypothenemus hampei TaxID=57062 RepID=A0ABD1ENY7_HYPHA